MGHVIILRGISGSGKSTARREKYPDALVVTTDDFFVQPNGEYVFDIDKKDEAHAWCLREFLYAATEMKRTGDDHPNTLIVDNTNIRVAEAAPYYELAKALEHSVQVVTIWADPIEAWQRNVHGVPQSVVDGQFRRLLEEGYRFPSWWDHKIWCVAGFQPKMEDIGTDYEQFLAMIQRADIPYTRSKSADCIVLEKLTQGGLFAGEIIIYFDKNGKMLNRGWVIPDEE